MTEKLLIVEDSKVFALMLTKLIRDNHGFEVQWVESYAQLKETLATTSTQYFAAIVDRHLPDAPNGESIDLVVNANIPTIVFTGTADEAQEEDLWAKNIADYAHKSSSYSVEYVVWMVKRLHSNASVDVLIVDDSVVARKTMAKLLKTQSYKVHIAENGQQALECLEANPTIRLAIIDCHMEIIDGFELVACIRDQFASYDMQIIGVSSNTGRQQSARFIKAGANDFLSKPFVPEEFLCRVNNVINRTEAFHQLKEANELKNKFLSMAAHDLRDPLGAINNAALFLQKKNDWPQERRDELLQMISSNSSDLQILLNDLLDLSNIESGELKLKCEDVKLKRVIKERVDLFNAQAESKEIMIHCDLEELPSASMDRIKIQQVIDNLMLNAIKYSPEKSHVYINLQKKDGHAQIRVTDSGKGVPKDERSRLFKPYEVLSTEATNGEKQTGLGLAIAKNIIDAHKGKIEYLDSDNGGACFSVTLPLLTACPN